MTQNLWGGRFTKTTDPLFERFSSSFQWDRRLWPFDLKIDRAHVQALKKCRVLSVAESRRLLLALGKLEKGLENGTLKLKEASEDVHSAIHAELERLAGSLANKLHTGRSRNDLVSQSSRLYCKAHAGRLMALIADLQKAMVKKAERHQAVLVPGMTHLQNAQVVSQAHIFLAYVEMLERSKERLEAARRSADVCVLGSGALAGVTFPLDQKMIARTLGLSRVAENSYDVSGDRDFVLDLLASIALLGVSLSRMAEDLMIGQTRSFSLMEIDQSYCTGSSMMPQKKNADLLELVRGAAGTFNGHLTAMLTALKGLPTSYNRDLQWDKKALFDSVETCESILKLFKGAVKTLEVNERKAESLLTDESLYATDLADYLVGKGVPFKDAHRQVGQIVSFAEEKGLPISRIGLDLLRKFASRVDGDIYGLLDAGHSVNMKRTVGSTNPARIKQQIAQWKRRLRGASADHA